MCVPQKRTGRILPQLLREPSVYARVRCPQWRASPPLLKCPVIDSPWNWSTVKNKPRKVIVWLKVETAEAKAVAAVKAEAVGDREMAAVGQAAPATPLEAAGRMRLRAGNSNEGFDYLPAAHHVTQGRRVLTRRPPFFFRIKFNSLTPASKMRSCKLASRLVVGASRLMNSRNQFPGFIPHSISRR